MAECWGRPRYVTTHNTTMALNPLSGKQLWKVEHELPQDVFKMTCCGILNRGVAIFDGKIYRVTPDAHVLAMDAKTGKQLWKSKAANYLDGHAMTAAPLIAGGVVITGIAGGEYGTRGFIDGWDPQSGKQLWRKYTTAAPGEKGGDTWPGDTHAKGGAPTWLTGAYDPELDLVYLGHRQRRPLEPASPAWRQPVRVLGAGDAAQDRRIGLALTVQPERRVWLRRHRSGHAGRPQD